MDTVSHLGAGIFTLQETHFKRKGKLNNVFSEFEVFEAIRPKQKGGTLIGAHKSHDPILIEEYLDEFELLVVDVTIGGKEEEIVKAKSSNKLVYIQMDANSKLGPDMIKGDPHAQSDNGKNSGSYHKTKCTVCH